VNRFVFRLARVLNLRRGLERERARALGRAIREEQERREALEQAQRQLGRFGEQVSESADAVTTVGTLANLRLALEKAADHVKQAEQQHDEAERAVTSEQDRFGEARREREVLERLRDRRHADWRQESSRLEQRELDEIARQRRAGGES
jgi:flagellar FliJ protein